MKALGYYFALPFLYFFSILPFKVLYFLSDFLVYPLLYLIVGYRKGVVRENLINSFPDKNTEELKKLEKKIYHQLSDLFVEIIKMFTISKKGLKKRMIYKNLPIINDWYLEGKSFVLTLGHYGNYEWIAQTLDMNFNHQGSGPYKEMSNSYFNNFFFKARTKYGTLMYPTYDTMKFLKQNHPKPFVLTLANDQSAPPTKSYWTRFLNQDTSFFFGTEKIAKDLNLPVVYAGVNKVKRGYYHVNLEVVTESPLEMTPGSILEKHANLLEEDILKDPSLWLWTHKRWKHKKPSEMPEGRV